MNTTKINNKGFTLIELLIAMTIFIAFVGVLFGSYISIISGQRDANNYRIMYSEARRVFDQITQEVRNGIVYYPENTAGIVSNDYNIELSKIVMLSKNLDSLVVFEKDDNNDLRFCKKKMIQNLDYKYDVGDGQSYLLNSAGSDIKISDFAIRVYPAADPYRTVNTKASSLQFQPIVHIDATFEKDLAGGNKYSLHISTSVSSRYYGEGPVLSAGTPSCDINSSYENIFNE